MKGAGGTVRSPWVTGQKTIGHTIRSSQRNETGEKTFYDLGENPVITCKDDLFQVKCENATLELSIADVRKYYFQAESTDLESVLSLSEIFIKASKEGVSIKNGEPTLSVAFLMVMRILFRSKGF